MTNNPASFNPNRCEPCRAGKRKCPGERPVCSSCIGKGRQCVYVNSAADSSANAKFRAASRSLTPKPAAKPKGTTKAAPQSKRSRKSLTAAPNDAAYGETGEEIPVGDAMEIDDADMLIFSVEEDVKTPALLSRGPNRRQKQKPPYKRATAPSPEDDNYVYVGTKLPAEYLAEQVKAEHEAALDALHDLRKIVTLPKMEIVHYDDIRLSALSPAAASIFLSISEKVYIAIDLGRDDVDLDIDLSKRKDLKRLILEVRELQVEHENGEETLIVALGKLAQSLRLVHDFYDGAAACFMTIGKLRTVLEKGKEGTWDQGSENY